MAQARGKLGVSYILDALRKSDQQRRRGAPPTLPQGQVMAAAPKRPALLSYGLLAFVLVGAGIAIGWLRPWHPDAAEPAPAATAATPSVPEKRQAQAARPELVSKPEAEAHAQNQAPATQPAAAPAPAPALAPPRAAAGARREKRSVPPKAPALAAEKASAPAQEQLPATAAADAAPAQNVISLAELPQAIQQELPSMTISVHAYSSTPAARMVGINNRMLHEGDDVVPGLKLQQITPDGMVFGYKGYSFRRGVK